MGIFNSSKEPELSNKNIYRENKESDKINSSHNSDNDIAVDSSEKVNNDSCYENVNRESIFFQIANIFSFFHHRLSDLVIGIICFVSSIYLFDQTSIIVTYNNYVFVEGQDSVGVSNPFLYLLLWISFVVFIFSINFSRRKEFDNYSDKNKYKYVLFLGILIISFSISILRLYVYGNDLHIEMFNIYVYFSVVFILLCIKNLSFIMLSEDQYCNIMKVEKISVE